MIRYRKPNRVRDAVGMAFLVLSLALLWVQISGFAVETGWAAHAPEKTGPTDGLVQDRVPLDLPDLLEVEAHC